MSETNSILSSNSCSIYAVIGKYCGSRLLDEIAEPIKLDDFGNHDAVIAFGKQEWTVFCEISRVEERQYAIDFRLKYTLKRGSLAQACVGARLEFNGWSAKDYMLMPAAAYNGNRFEVRKMSYPPQLFDNNDLRIDSPTLITDVPRLNISSGASGIQQLTGDLATPAVGFYAKEAGMGFWLLTEQSTSLGDSGIAFEENSERSRAWVELTAPGMRRDYKYSMCNTLEECSDRGADFKEGDSAEIRFRVYFFKCSKIQQLFDYFTIIRKDMTGAVELRHMLPFSTAHEIIERKYNSQNWKNELGYYSVSLFDEIIYSDWQVGWVGGMIATYPLLLDGNDLSRKRALRNFDFLFSGGQSPSGFLHGCSYKGKWYGDCFKDPAKPWHLIRKSSDALYQIIKQLMLMDKLEACQASSIHAKTEWLEGTRRLADAFVNIWRRYGQFGQFINTSSGDIIIGGSTSGGIAPAGLALAWQYFGDDAYIEVAREAMEYYYDNYVEKGISTGGPGEILQCPDSESAFGLLESFMILYETTCERQWLDKAIEMANQCFTWCVSYDFLFPNESTFGKLGMRTAGSVYANVQNKHSAPGICTLSGNSLFKLYRYTKNIKYLELIQEISHNITQYVSRDDRPIKAQNGLYMPEGWVNERVEMSDWLEPVGEVFYGSCWSEVSIMLTYAELPGIYLHNDTGFVCCMDNVDAAAILNDDKRLLLKISNSTAFSANIKIFDESSSNTSRIIGQNYLLDCRRAIVEPGSCIELEFKKY